MQTNRMVSIWWGTFAVSGLMLWICMWAEHGFTLCEKYPNMDFFSGPYFSVFTPKTGKYGPEKIPYLDTSHAM